MQRPYRRHYRDAMTNAFDAYLSMLRIIDQRVDAAFGRDTPDWRVLNACPPCTYEVSRFNSLTMRNADTTRHSQPATRRTEFKVQQNIRDGR